MAAAPLPHPTVAWPLAPATDDAGRCVGYLLRATTLDVDANALATLTLA